MVADPLEISGRPALDNITLAEHLEDLARWATLNPDKSPGNDVEGMAHPLEVIAMALRLNLLEPELFRPLEEELDAVAKRHHQLHEAIRALIPDEMPRNPHLRYRYS